MSKPKALAKPTGKGKLRFVTRNYKLELPLNRPDRGIATFTEAAWACKKIDDGEIIIQLIGSVLTIIKMTTRFLFTK